MSRALVVAAAGLLVLVAGCGNDSHKGEHCIAHDTILVPIVQMVGKIAVTSYVYESHCTLWAFDNPQTASPGQQP